MGACRPVIQLTDACPTFYLVLADSCFLSSLESIVRRPNSHFTYLQAFISYLFMVSHCGTSCTFLYPKLISFVLFFFFFLDKCFYSSNLNEPIPPKVYAVLRGFTMWSHCVFPTLCNHQVLDLQLERSFLKLICSCYHILKQNLGISIVL